MLIPANIKYPQFPMGETAIRLALRTQWIMGLYYSMTFYETRIIPTLATNGVACWVNPDFWTQLNRDQRLTATAHEIGHRMLCHSTRLGARDPFVWNLAGDYIINPMLVEAGFVPLENLVINGKKWSWCYDLKIVEAGGRTTEGVYDYLVKEAEKRGGATTGGAQGEDESEAGGGGEAEGEDDSSDDPSQRGDSGSSDGAEGGAGAANGASRVRNVCGGRTRNQNPAAEAAERRLGPMRDLCHYGTDPNGDVHNGDAEESPLQFEQRVSKEVKEAEARAKMIGNVPGWMQRVVANVDHQKVNWWEVLEDYVKGLTLADYSWSRFNRRELVKTGVISPDMWQPTLNHMLIIFDTSGSMGSREFGIMAGHFKDIIEQVKPRKVTAMYCDTRPTKVDEFTRSDFEGDVTQLNPVGGGGTDFSWFDDWIAELEEQPDVAICITDMCAVFGPAPDVPFIWLSTTSITQAPYGDLISVN